MAKSWGGKERDRRLVGISLVKDELVRFPVVGGRIGRIVSPGRSIDRPGSLPDRYVPPEKDGPAPIPSALAQHCTGCFGGSLCRRSRCGTASPIPLLDFSLFLNCFVFSVIVVIHEVETKAA